MRITFDLFDAYLRCPMKYWLRAASEVSTGNIYAEWVKTQDESYVTHQAARLVGESSNSEVATSLAVENLKSARWKLTTNIPFQAQVNSCFVESRLHAVERISSEGRGKSTQFIPIRFIFRNKLTKDDKLLLAFDAFLLSESLGREVTVGKIIHGDDHTTLRVKTSAFTGETRKALGRITVLLTSEKPPDLVLNRHCSECEFRDRCRQKAIEADDLSLLAGMSAKERQKLRSKGIFTVTQLSYTFRPRRRPKRLRDKREKYHHALKALAIREKKIHIVGSPKLKIEGTPVYLDVEGLPDRDFYYLIGLRIGHGDTAVQHSLWADTIADEGRIWREFLAILETVERPVLIHYGSYETDFLKIMRARYGEPPEESAAKRALGSVVNVLSLIYAQIYFPTFSNGLKEIGGWAGFKWPDGEHSGTRAIVCRHQWELSRDPALEMLLTTYNALDCEVLERVCSFIRASINHSSANDGAASDKSEVVRAESVKDYRLQRWREFKSPFPEFEAFARAAHWNCQRNRVGVQTRQPFRRSTNLWRKPSAETKIYRQVVSRTSRVCPGCMKRKRGRSLVKTRYRLELFTGRASLKVRLVRYVFQTYFCRRCNLTFGGDAHFKDLHRFGWSLVSFLVYQIIELNLSQRKVAESFSRIFGIAMAVGTLNGLKAHVADYYRETWRQIISRIARGHLVHADETKFHLQNASGYVWVLTNLHEVAYVFSPSREAELPKDLLSAFRGVLVSDFYAAYDSLACNHQRCLIHLIRHLNDEVLDHPYDEELKNIVTSFGELLKPIIETVERRGLKAHFLRKFMPVARRFFAKLAQMPLTSDPAQKCRQRFERNRDELFTFLEHDGVPWNNNNAEHAIKAVARLRKLVTGLTTQKGLEEYLILLSVCQTCKYMGVDFLDFLRSGERDIHAFAESRRRRRKPSLIEVTPLHS
jgi:predicted RecB family nuclease